MRAALQWGIVLVLWLGWGARARAQTFDHVRVASLGVGMLIPSGEMSNGYEPGVVGRAALRMSVSRGTSVGVESGYYGPNAKSGSPTLYQIPVRLLLYFPVASEAGSTPYFALGPGVTFSTVGDDAVPGGSTNPDPYFTYALKAGWAFRPEHMSHTLFEIGGRYEQQFIGHSPDFEAFDVEVCVGRTF